MFKTYLTSILTVLVLHLSLCSSVFAQTKEEKDAKLAEKVKVNVAKLGTGKDARVEVKLKDGTKIKGYISQINENGFAVNNEKTGTAMEIPYTQTKQVKGKNMSTGDKIWIAAGIISVGLIVAISLAFRAESCPCN